MNHSSLKYILASQLLLTISGNSSAIGVFEPNELHITLPSQLNVDNEVPNNTVIWTSPIFSVNLTDTYENSGSAIIIFKGPERLMAPGYPETYASNIPGLGFRIKGTLRGPAIRDMLIQFLPYTGYSPPLGITNRYNYKQDFYLEAIKLGNVAPGNLTIHPDTQATVRFNDAGQGPSKLTLHFSGSASVSTSSCQIKATSIDLGSPSIGIFNKVGATSALKPFQVAIENCPDGINNIHYKITPTTQVISAEKGLFALTSGGALGIGIQLLNDAEKAVPLNTYLPYSNPQGRSRFFSIPFKASYYQLENQVSAGVANSGATITLSYE